MWDLIVSVPDHCLSFYFAKETRKLVTFKLFEYLIISIPEF